MSWDNGGIKNLVHHKMNEMSSDHDLDLQSSTLWRLLELPNCLLILRCWHCKGVTKDDHRAIKDAIKDCNLTLYWEW